MTANTQSKHQEKQNNQSPEALLVRGVKIPRIGGVTFTREEKKKQIQDYIALTDKVATIVDRDMEKIEKRKKSIRHTVPESDFVVQFLLSLEERYKDNPEELKLVKSIIVHKDTIEIAGYEIKRVNEEAPEDRNKGILKNSKGKTLWKCKAAMDYTKTQTGYKCLSDTEWTEVCNAIPGKSDDEHSRNAIAIFEFSLEGYRDPGGGLDGENDEDGFWSSSPNGPRGAFYRFFHRHGNRVGRGSVNQDCSFSLRLAKDKGLLKKMQELKLNQSIFYKFKEKIFNILETEEFFKDKNKGTDNLDFKKMMKNDEKISRKTN